MQAKSHILPTLLALNLGQIQEICRTHKVKRMWAFGSVLREDFHEESDVDLLYELDREQLDEDNF